MRYNWQQTGRARLHFTLFYLKFTVKIENLCLHSNWSLNAGWNVVYMFMGYTAEFAVELLTSSVILPKERLQQHESIGP